MFYVYGTYPGEPWALVASAPTAACTVKLYETALQRFPSLMVRGTNGEVVDLPQLMNTAEGELPQKP